MSDMLNHYCCGRDSLKQLPADSKLRKIILDHYDAYRLGTQGPDFFYYHHPIPLIKPYPPLHYYATLIHTSRVDSFFYYGLKYALTSRDKNIILSYMAGFFTHHTLDTITHPYIFCKTGRYIKGQPETRIFSYDHKYFEVLLDVAFYQYQYQKTASSFTFEKLYTPQKATVMALEHFYTFMMECVYNESVRMGCIRDCLRDASQLASAFADPHARKRHLISPIEKIVGEDKVLSRALYPMYTNEFAILNLNHSTWHHPVTGETYTHSYPQLFEHAVHKSVKRLLILETLLTKPGFKEDIIHKIFENCAYDTGLPCEDNRKMRYFDLFFDEHPNF